MKPLSFRVDLTPSPDSVVVSVVSPDGEVEELANLDSPAQLLGFGPMFAAYMATMVTLAVMQSREG